MKGIETVWLVGLMTAGVVLTLSAEPVKPACLDGRYVFDATASDEFDGTRLDASKWLDWVASFQGRSRGFLFARDNVALRDGRLELTARLLREDEKTVENLRRGYDTYATAIVKATRKTHYGYYECRAKTMHANVCNAFWLYDPLSDLPKKKYRPGDTSEEIDIFELFGKEGTVPGARCDRTLFFTVHRLDTPYLEGIVNGGARKLPNKSFRGTADFDFWADYHVYGFLWTEREMKWYVDGKEMFARANDVFRRPMHVTFDCEIMYDWTGEPERADLPQVYSIDYFRHWKLMSAAQAPLVSHMSDSVVHRGDGSTRAPGSTSLPENSLQALERCWQRGYIPEVDLQRSSDGVYFIFHDPTYRGRKIGEYSWTEAREIDIGAIGNCSLKGVYPPKMSEVFDALAKDPARRLVIDKMSGEKLEWAAAEVVRRGLARQAYCCTGATATCRKWKRLVPGGRALCWIWTGTWKDVDIADPAVAAAIEANLRSRLDALEKEDYAGPDIIQIHVRTLKRDGRHLFAPSEALLRKACGQIRAKGINVQLMPWTGGDDPDVYRRFAEMGAMSFGTDYPDVFEKGL